MKYDSYHNQERIHLKTQTCDKKHVNNSLVGKTSRITHDPSTPVNGLIQSYSVTPTMSSLCLHVTLT